MTIEKDIFKDYQEQLLKKSLKRNSVNTNYFELDEIDRDNIENVIKPLQATEYIGSRNEYVPLDNEETIRVERSELEKKILASTNTMSDIMNISKDVSILMSASVDIDVNELYTDEDGNSTRSKGSELTWMEDILIKNISARTSLDSSMEAVTDGIAGLVEMLPNITAAVFNVVSVVGNVVGKVAGGVVGGVKGAFNWMKKGVGGIIDGKGFSDFKGSNFTEGYESGVEATTLIPNLMDSVMSMGQDALQSYTDWMAGTLRNIGGTYASKYIDGISETKFGQKQEESWTRFVSANINNKIKWSEHDPISDIGTEPILFGAPPRYNVLSDPRDRAYMNTFIKDGSILSIIPGKPKYNGLNLSREKYSGSNTGGTKFGNWINDMGSGSNGWLQSGFAKMQNDKEEHRTTDETAQGYADVALRYLKANGISETFNEHDRRYYTFEEDYAEYYSYLETILNTIYVRMGLGESISDGNKTELFSFFKNPGSASSELKEKFYGKALGFYFDGNAQVSESTSNTAHDPTGSKGMADALSDEMQAINYATGFGRNSVRNAGVAVTQIGAAVETGKQAFNGGINTFGTVGSWFGSNPVGTALKAVGSTADKLLNVATFNSKNDLNVLTQQMMTSNGMKTEFPKLWTDSSSSKSISVDFEFISPYGDPLSIFQHVYTPLAAILALALPKQAAENGYVNPFFLRMDIPGVISSDFAMISNISWIRGGSQNLWTVDRHPRAITISVTFEDLYEYLAMTKRVSYLAANPNYSMFLDSFSGIRSLYGNGDMINSDYWSLLVNRLNSKTSFNSDTWNVNDVDKQINRYVNDSYMDREKFFSNYYKRDLPWMKNR